jgi:hypothetical protein
MQIDLTHLEMDAASSDSSSIIFSEEEQEAVQNEETTTTTTQMQNAGGNDDGEADTEVRPGSDSHWQAQHAYSRRNNMATSVEYEESDAWMLNRQEGDVAAIDAGPSRSRAAEDDDEIDDVSSRSLAEEEDDITDYTPSAER